MELINKIIDLLLNNDNSIQLLSMLVSMAIAFFTAYFTSKSEIRKSTTEYFKQAGIEKQENILTFWYNIVNDYDKTIKEYKVKYELDDNTEDVELMKLVQADSYIYSSKQSVSAIADYMQYVFKNKGKSGMVLLVLLARVISLLKYDFTGEKPKVIDILKIRINDFNIKKSIKLNIILFYYKFKNRIKFGILLLIISLPYLVIF